MNELKNILDIQKAYKQNSLDGIDEDIKLYLLVVKNSQTDFLDTLCLVKSELEAYSLLYEVAYNYKTKKHYTLEIQPNSFSIKAIKTLTLKEVFSNEEYKKLLELRLSDGITPYSYEEVKVIGENYQLIWDIDQREPQFFVLQDGKIIQPKDTSNMPFYFSGNARVMIKDKKYGIIKSNGFFDNINYKVWIDFTYHYIRSDNFGNFELLKDKPHSTDFKKLTCELLLEDGELIQNVLLNSTTKDEYITTKDDMLIYHKGSKTSKPYKDIILNAFETKAVQCKNNLWGYIDKDLKEIIPCKFEDWNFFHDGYAVLKDKSGYFVIDQKGDVLFKEMEFIKHYKNDLFFVKKDSLWGVYKKEKLFIEFFDLHKEIEQIKKENNLGDDEVFDFLHESYFSKTMLFANVSDVYELILREKIYEKNKKLSQKMYEMPLKEYVKLFNLKTKNDLIDAKLWGKKVKTKDGRVGYIHWEYPASASLYDMRLELPVDGFGVRIEELELVRDE